MMDEPATMTGECFSRWVESVGLEASVFAKSVGVTEDQVAHWMASRPSEEAVSFVYALDAALDLAVVRAIECVAGAGREGRKGVVVALPSYTRDDDALVHASDLPMTVKIYNVFIDRLRAHLNASGAALLELIVFDAREYDFWRRGREDSAAMRTQWASDIACSASDRTWPPDSDNVGIH